MCQFLFPFLFPFRNVLWQSDGLHLSSELFSRTIIRIFISVQHTVGSGDERSRRCVGCRTQRISDTERQRVRQIALFRFFCERISNRLYERVGISYVLRFDDYDKFIAAPSGDKAVIRTSDFLKCFGNDFERSVAFQVPVRIIDVFKAVYIRNKKIQRAELGNRCKFI